MMLESIDDLQLGTPFSYAFFSVLKPGASIATHSAPCNIRLRCHLPLFVPDVPVGTCAMRVGDQFVQVRGERGEREGCTVQCAAVFVVVCSVLCVLYSVFQQLWLLWCSQCADVFAVCTVGGVLIVLRV